MRRLQVGIIPVDVEASVAFYSSGLGLPLQSVITIGGGRRMHAFAVGDGVLKVLDHLGEAPAGRAAPAPWGAATGMRWITVDVDDLDAVLVTAAEFGGTVTDPAVELRPGIRVAFVADPDGNAVELVERR